MLDVFPAPCRQADVQGRAELGLALGLAGDAVVYLTASESSGLVERLRPRGRTGRGRAEWTQPEGDFFQASALEDVFEKPGAAIGGLLPPPLHCCWKSRHEDTGCRLHRRSIGPSALPT